MKRGAALAMLAFVSGMLCAVALASLLGLYGAWLFVLGASLFALFAHGAAWLDRGRSGFDA